ncbi:MAG: isopenicillin N synthase family oxygenase [Alphaproteobacteria bacterium]|nr:isopenicillin N synthase family oxygenase [Alphaproteobacteria bacterium]
MSSPSAPMDAARAAEAGVPVVDMSDYRGADPAARVAFIDTLGRGLEDFGFVAVTGHGVDAELLERAYSLTQALFDLPLSVKRGYETPGDGRQRGYTSFGVEHAKDQRMPDLKEFWHIGRSLGAEHPLHLSGAIPPNQLPAELPEFGAMAVGLFDALEGFALQLLDAVGEYLGLREGFFRRLTRDGNSVLRLIHYPDLGDKSLQGAVRAAAHEDINLLTVLPASTRPGLELMTRDGEWMPVQTPPNVMLCDTGDMMSLITGGQLPATTHRVVNPPDSDGGRYSMPFFLHPHPHRELRPIRGGDRPPVLAQDFLKRRLREIGVA